MLVTAAMVLTSVARISLTVFQKADAENFGARMIVAPAASVPASE